MSRPVRVALVNDYAIVVRGMCRMLTDVPDRIQIVEFDLQTGVKNPVDVALYDNFGAIPGHAVDIADLVENPNVGAVVVYTWKMQRELIDAALAQGVRGYLSKSLGREALVVALERVAAGEHVVLPEGDIGESGSIEVVAGDWPGREVGLSARQAEIVSLITAGLTNAEIAASTYLSMNTVKTYIRHAYQHMGVTTRTQAVLWGVQHDMGPDRARRKEDPVREV